MKKANKFLLILLLVIVIGGAGVFAFVSNSLEKVNNGAKKIVKISEGMYGRSVYELLEDEGMIKNSDIAYLYSRFFIKPDIKAGSFELSDDMSVKEIVEYISDANNAIQNTVRITFVEGGWLKGYAKQIAEATNLSKEELLMAWNDESYIRELMADYPFLTEEIFNDNIRFYLEGYLFPDTYEFFKETSVDAVTRKMLDQTLRVYEANKDAFINNERFSTHQIFTLASIVQYEANSFEDMQKVASVFMNRLDIGMMLQSSVTVCYAIDLEADGDWVECERNADFDSPYNTYMNYGLTPGPIVAASENAIRAVLDPASTDYLYFIGDVCGDGTVYFSSTYAQHLAYVEEYLWCY